MKPVPSRRLKSLPPYLFVRLAKLKRQAQASGLDVIDLGQGSPDLPSPANVVAALKTAVDDPSTHRYPQNDGMPALRQAIADWYDRRFGVSLDPDTEVLPLIGSKEGIAHLLMAMLEKDEMVLVPNPCYPVHVNGVVLAGGKPVFMPLKEENGFLPDLKKIPKSQARAAKAMILNYPNNPTGAVVEGYHFLEEALAFSRKNGGLIMYDNAYSELTFDKYQAPSILQVPHAKKYAVEFHSLSKTYSMAGWRIGFVVGNPDAIGYLAKFKSFLDYGIPSFIQKAAIEALQGPQDSVDTARKTYQRRRDVMVKALSKIGWDMPTSRATMYLWGKGPKAAGKMKTLAFAERLILEQGVVISPGIGFGPHGEGYFRISLIADEPVLEEAAARIGRFLSNLKT